VNDPRNFGVSMSLAQGVGAARLLVVLLVLVTMTGIGVAQSYTETILHSFTGQPDGGDPEGTLLLNAQGKLYGTTFGGGTFGYGAIFSVGTDGTETILYSFGGMKGDGMYPSAGLVMDSQGNLYGTTIGGSSCNGTVFKFNPTTGKETRLHCFEGQSDGATPIAALVLDAKGNLYGTTREGGNRAYCQKLGCGTVFKVTTTGTESIETVLYSFTGVDGDGWNPVARLLIAQGNLYGTTSAGGGSNAGTVFKLDSTGKETILYSFMGGLDGSGPQGGLVMNARGELYGTTAYFGKQHCLGGGFDCGTVFKLDAAGKESVLYSFAGSPTDGANPCADLLLDAHGNLYGTTEYGGLDNWGTAFKLDITGKETLLYSFNVGGPGQGPKAGLVQDAQGNLYGDDTGGDNNNDGFVFELSPP
jgi:uncharacterized repeat protein (TIGR03803 family)